MSRRGKPAALSGSPRPAATEATLGGASRPMPATAAPAGTPVQAPAPIGDVDQGRLQELEEQLAETLAFIPPGYQRQWVTLDQIRLDRPYDKEPIPDYWIESTAESIAEEGLKHLIRLDQSKRILAGQVRTSALRLLRGSDADAFKQHFPTGQIPVLVHDDLNWEEDPDACERELQVLQRSREMPETELRNRYILEEVYRALTDPKANWATAGRPSKGSYRPIKGAAQRWAMSERHLHRLLTPLQGVMADRQALGGRASAKELAAFGKTLTPLEQLIEQHTPSRRARREGGKARSWKHYVYHAHKSAASLRENLQSVDSPLQDLAAVLQEVLDDSRKAEQRPQLSAALIGRFAQIIDQWEPETADSANGKQLVASTSNDDDLFAEDG